MALPPSQPPLDYAKGFDDLKSGIERPSKLRKIATAQAAAGGARAALDWIVRLDATRAVPPFIAKEAKESQDLWKDLVTDNKIEARLGIVDGVRQRVKGDSRASADDWYDHW